MKIKMIIASLTMAALVACGGGDSPVGDADAPTEPAAVVPASPGNAINGYIGRANDVAADLEDRNASLEGLTP